MKFRTRFSRNIKNKKEKVNVWSSFVDIMSTVSLVFLLVMMSALGMFIQIKQKTDDISKQRNELYTKIEKQLKPTLGNDVVYEDGFLQIKSSLLFDTDSAKLNKHGKKIAKEIGNSFLLVLNDDENRQKIEAIKIVGHTDNNYDAEYNRTLSTERAVSFVNQMLDDKSKDAKYGEYFEASGMSKYSPKSGTVEKQTEKEKEQNRRIEIKIEFSDKDIAEYITSSLKY